jgi:hypothetical protein
VPKSPFSLLTAGTTFLLLPVALVHLKFPTLPCIIHGHGHTMVVIQWPCLQPTKMMMNITHIRYCTLTTSLSVTPSLPPPTSHFLFQLKRHPGSPAEQ